MGRITDTVKHLIIINILFFVAKLAMPEMMDRLFALYYFESPNFRFWQPVTHMFMHGDFGHILFNMFGLYMFGSPLEARWGRNKFLFFYFSAGLGAALIHSAVNYYHFQSVYDALTQIGMSAGDIQGILTEGSFNTAILENITQAKIQSFYEAYHIPAVGASGAIYGVLVAFGMLFPNTPLMLIFLPVPIKAKYFIPAIIALDLFSGVTGYSLMGQGIAHWAHIGGALFGFIMAYYWKKNSFNNKRWY
ncbi:MAG: rhomboid family intramembrane serine protease [Bacteroidetes bacterium]|nr:rhomboid family intramembrane serine protease [Bacteroidota bacterium]